MSTLEQVREFLEGTSRVGIAQKRKFAEPSPPPRSSATIVLCHPKGPFIGHEVLKCPTGRPTAPGTGPWAPRKPMATSSEPDPRKLLLTSELLQRAKEGDRDALEALTARYLPRLERWASGRLPPHARTLVDTVDLVQDTMLRVIEGLQRVEVRGPGSFQAYVRKAVLNRIRDEIRWAQRRPGPDGVPEVLPDPRPSPLEDAIGANVLDQYERALERLPEEARQLLHLRIELDFDYDEIAAMTGRVSTAAARMAVRRALTALAEVMGQQR